MKCKSVFVGALIGCTILLGSAAAALADYTPAGSNAYPGVVLTSPGFTFGDTAAGATLNDKWFFNFTAPTFLATADASNSDGAYNNFQLSLYNADTDTVVLGGTGNVANAPVNYSKIGPLVLAPGHYYLQLVGTGLVGFIGPETVGGTLNVQAVPVPGALPLFATGLGMLGFLATRRRKRASI
jgi:hypothetical protein